MLFRAICWEGRSVGAEYGMRDDEMILSEKNGYAGVGTNTETIALRTAVNNTV